MISTQEFIRKKITDRKIAAKAVKMVSQKNPVVNFDFDDVNAILDKGSHFAYLEGDEEVMNRIERREDVTGVLLLIEGSRKMALEDVDSIAKNLLANTKKDADVVWCLNVDKKKTKSKIKILICYKDN